MRNPKLMRKRANVSMLDSGRIKSDQEAVGKYCARIISISLNPPTPHPPFPGGWPTFTLRCLSNYYSSYCMYFVHSFFCCTHQCMVNCLFEVSHYNVGCCAFLYELLPTQKGSVSTQEIVKRTDRVPHMSALLLFNITTEHTLNSTHGALPFDM